MCLSESPYALYLCVSSCTPSPLPSTPQSFPQEHHQKAPSQVCFAALMSHLCTTMAWFFDISRTPTTSVRPSLLPPSPTPPFPLLIYLLCFSRIRVSYKSSGTNQASSHRCFPSITSLSSYWHPPVPSHITTVNKEHYPSDAHRLGRHCTANIDFILCASWIAKRCPGSLKRGLGTSREHRENQVKVNSPVGK